MSVLSFFLSFFFLSSFQDQNNKRIVLALQSGLKSELTWALNTLTLLSFKEKDDVRRDATPLAKITGLLDALLQVVGATNLVLLTACICLCSIKMFDEDLLKLFLYLLSELLLFLIICNVISFTLYKLKQIDDWRDIALPKELVKTPRVRSLGANSVVTGFGNEYQQLGSTGTLHRPG